MAANTVMVRLDSLPEATVNQIMTAAGAPSLPAVTSSDNGKVLKVGSGEWKAVTDPLPAVTSADNGKVLMVVDGAWAVAEIPSQTK